MNQMKTKMTNVLTALLLGATALVFSTNSSAQDGSQLFTTNCAVCHKTSAAKLVGPGMAGITDKRSKEWLKSWIKDSQKLIASGDADAKAIYQEYGNSPMPGFPQLSDLDMEALITYLGTLGSGDAAAADVPMEEIFYTDLQVIDGKKYFTGNKSFFNGGPSCASCHNVNDKEVSGGFLAKDLTDVYVRLGEAGIMAMITNAPFPAMSAAYINNPLGEFEQKSLAAYLKSISTNQPASISSSVTLFFSLGTAGFIVVLILIMIIWGKRKKHSVKEAIFARQLKAIN